MGEGLLTKFKNWVTVEDEEEEDYVEDTYEEIEEEEGNYSAIANNRTSKIVNLHAQSSNMKVVIVEPKKYEEVTEIADHLKQKRTVIVNLENLHDATVRRCIFEFMSGAVYVLEGDMQKVSKGIFILAPHNVNIDASLKKELESKTLFPWQSK